jgi:predicted DNA-binding protein (MmcQ/YjbR family)
MINVEIAYEICLSILGCEEYEHFDKVGFKVKGTTFATLNLEQKWCTLKFTPEQQVEYSEHPAIFPVPNKWGKQGWTHCELEKIRQDEFTTFIKIASQNVLVKKLKIKKIKI